MAQLNFKGIRANEKTQKGETIYSGQIVKVHGRINAVENQEVYFEPNHGFKVQGNNFADAYMIEVVKDISWMDKLLGTISFALYSIFGFYRNPQKKVSNKWMGVAKHIQEIILHDNGAINRFEPIKYNEEYLNLIAKASKLFFTKYPEMLKDEHLMEICAGEESERSEKYGKLKHYKELDTILNRYFEEVICKPYIKT
jgi:hypothetical protein